jgi:hypothetical protein
MRPLSVLNAPPDQGKDQRTLFWLQDAAVISPSLGKTIKQPKQRTWTLLMARSHGPPCLEAPGPMEAEWLGRLLGISGPSPTATPSRLTRRLSMQPLSQICICLRFDLRLRVPCISHLKRESTTILFVKKWKKFWFSLRYSSKTLIRISWKYQWTL